MKTVERDSLDTSAIEPAATAPPPESFARLVIRGPQGAGADKDVLRPTTLIGAADSCNIQLVGPAIGAAHCAVTLEAGGLYVYDLRSPGGTWLNDRRIEAAPLAGGDRLRIGPFECRIETNLSPAADAADYVGAVARLAIAGREGRSVLKDILRPSTLVGRLEGTNVRLVSAEIAPLHALITLHNGRLQIRDLRTRAGTRVNSRPVTVETLGHGDVIEIGPFRARVETSLSPTIQDPLKLVDEQLEPASGSADVGTVPPDIGGSGESKRLSDLRRTIEAEQATLQSERESVERQSQLLETRTVDLLAQEAAMREGRLAVDRQRELLAEEQKRLLEVREQIDGDRARLQASETALDEQTHALDRRMGELEAREAALDGEKQTIDRQRETLVREQDRQRAAQERLIAENAALRSAKEELEKRASTLETRSAELRKREKLFLGEKQAHDRSRESLELERQRQREAEELIAAERADLQKGIAELDRQTREIETRTANLLAGEETLRSEREAFERELAEVASRQQEQLSVGRRLEAVRAELARSRDRLESDRASLGAERAESQAARQRLEEELASRANHLAERELEIDNLRKNLQDDRAVFDRRTVEIEEESKRLSLRSEECEGAQRALEEQRSQLDQARRELTESTARFDEQQKNLGRLRQELAELERVLKERETSAAAALADLSARQAELDAGEGRVESERRELSQQRGQLQQAEALLRAAQKQFQVSLDELRSEQRRFQTALLSISVDRDRARRRKESKELAAQDRRLGELLRSEDWLSGAQAGWFVTGRFDDARLVDFRIVDLIALGATEWIYEAEDLATGKRVALKVLKRSAAHDPEQRRRLAREAKIGQALAHANIVRTVSWFEPDDDAPFLAMELVDGVDLRELIALHGRLPWREACNYGFLAAVGLAALHTAGIIHGDVQPSNLLIQRDGGLKIADFGSAGEAAGTGEIADAEHPRESQWLPTRSAYSPPAPEESEGSALNDPRSDVFSLGATILHALTGDAPISGGERGERQSPAESLARAHSWPSDVPADVVAIVEKMTAISPAERFASMDEVARAFSSWGRRQYAFFDRRLILTRRAGAARLRLREEARHLAEFRKTSEPPPTPDRAAVAGGIEQESN